MPSGQIHARYARVTLAYTTVLGGLVGAAGAVLVDPSLGIAAGLGIALGGFVGYIAPPDLDHHKKTYDEARIERWNPALGKRWIKFWEPYELANAHQGRSHKLPQGTWDRFWYLLKLPVWISWLPLVILLPLGLGLGCWALFWATVFAGQLCQDMVHIWLDTLVKIKRWFRRLWPFRRQAKASPRNRRQPVL